MQTLVFPVSASFPATHKSPSGDCVHVQQIADSAKIHGAAPVDTSGYTVLPPAEATKANVLAAALAKFEAQIAAGIRLPAPGGQIILAATPADQNNFANLVTHLGNEAGPADANITIADHAGALHTMTVAQFKTLMGAYGRAVYSSWASYQQSVAAIKAA